MLFARARRRIVATQRSMARGPVSTEREKSLRGPPKDRHFLTERRVFLARARYRPVGIDAPRAVQERTGGPWARAGRRGHRPLPRGALSPVEPYHPKGPRRRRT